MGFNWILISPEIAVLATGFILLILDLFIGKSRGFLLTAVSFIGIMVALWLNYQNYSIMGVGFQGIVINDPIGFYFKIIFCMGTLLTVFISSTYVSREMKGMGEYYVLIFIATFGMMVMASSADLITIFLGLEVMSIPLYVLAGIHRGRLRGREAAMKYFLLGAFASGFLLYGIALIFGAYGSTNLVEISQRFLFSSGFSGILTGAGMVFLLVGFGFKIAAAPFHMWVPDVYEGATAPVTAFMSAGPKAAAFAVLFRLFSVFQPVISDNFTTILWILAVITMLWGNLLALSQKNIKRMLAYSSIAHAGYVLIALTVGGRDGISAGLFYLLIYTIVNIGAFSIIIFFSGKNEKYENISDYAGFGYKYPFAAIAMTVFMLALAGFPATAGFAGKYKIFVAAINSGFIWLAIIGIFNSLVSVWYYIGVVVSMYMKQPRDESPTVILSMTLMVAVLVAFIGTVYLGLFPDDWIALSDWAGSHYSWASIVGSLVR